MIVDWVIMNNDHCHIQWILSIQHEQLLLALSFECQPPPPAMKIPPLTPHPPIMQPSKNAVREGEEAKINNVTCLFPLSGSCPVSSVHQGKFKSQTPSFCSQLQAMKTPHHDPSPSSNVPIKSTPLQMFPTKNARGRMSPLLFPLSPLSNVHIYYIPSVHIYYIPSVPSVHV